MASKLRPKLSYANVVATACLFVVLGGSSVAAPVRDGAKRLITGKQVKDSSLTTKDIKNASLLSKDFKAGQIPPGRASGHPSCARRRSRRCHVRSS